MTTAGHSGPLPTALWPRLRPRRGLSTLPVPCPSLGHMGVAPPAPLSNNAPLSTLSVDCLHQTHCVCPLAVCAPGHELPEGGNPPVGFTSAASTGLTLKAGRQAARPQALVGSTGGRQGRPPAPVPPDKRARFLPCPRARAGTRQHMLVKNQLEHFPLCGSQRSLIFF